MIVLCCGEIRKKTKKKLYLHENRNKGTTEHRKNKFSKLSKTNAMFFVQTIKIKKLNEFMRRMYVQKKGTLYCGYKMKTEQ